MIKRINACNTIAELNLLKLAIVKDAANFKINRREYVRRKNKIKLHGGIINE